MDMEVGNEMKSSTTLFVMNTVLNGSKRWNEICNVRSKWNDMCEGSSNWSESHDERRFIHDGISNQNKILTRELSTEMKFAMMTWNLCTMEVATEMKFASSTGNEICDKNRNPNENYDGKRELGVNKFTAVELNLPRN